MESGILVDFSVIAAFLLLLLVCILESSYILIKLCEGEALPKGKEKVRGKKIHQLPEITWKPSYFCL